MLGYQKPMWRLHCSKAFIYWIPKTQLLGLSIISISGYLYSNNCLTTKSPLGVMMECSDLLLASKSSFPLEYNTVQNRAYISLKWHYPVLFFSILIAFFVPFPSVGRHRQHRLSVAIHSILTNCFQMFSTHSSIKPLDHILRSCSQIIPTTICYQVNNSSSNARIKKWHTEDGSWKMTSSGNNDKVKKSITSTVYI